MRVTPAFGDCSPLCGGRALLTSRHGLRFHSVFFKGVGRGRACMLHNSTFTLLTPHGPRSASPTSATYDHPASIWTWACSALMYHYCCLFCCSTTTAFGRGHLRAQWWHTTVRAFEETCRCVDARGLFDAAPVTEKPRCVRPGYIWKTLCSRNCSSEKKGENVVASP